eukprot:1350903-Pleurochrysis_carterae.AAC.2
MNGLLESALGAQAGRSGPRDIRIVPQTPTPNEWQKRTAAARVRRESKSANVGKVAVSVGCGPKLAYR